MTCLSFGVQAQDPTAETVIENYIKAIGGREAIDKIKDITISSTSENPRGTAETEIKMKMPDKYMMSVYTNGMELYSIVNNGEKSVRKSQWGGGNQEAKEGKEAKAEAMRMSPFQEMNYVVLEIKMKNMGLEKVGETEAYKLEFTGQTGNVFYAWFDKTSGLKLKTSMKGKNPRSGEEIENITTLENYTKFKGTEVLIPKISKRSGGPMGESVSETQSVKVNKGLEDKVFEIK